MIRCHQKPCWLRVNMRMTRATPVTRKPISPSPDTWWWICQKHTTASTTTTVMKKHIVWLFVPVPHSCTIVCPITQTAQTNPKASTAPRKKRIRVPPWCQQEMSLKSQYMTTAKADMRIAETMRLKPRPVWQKKMKAARRRLEMPQKSQASELQAWSTAAQKPTPPKMTITVPRIIIC